MSVSLSSSSTPSERPLTLSDTGTEDADVLLRRYGLELVCVSGGTPIPGSFWGEPEAGITRRTVYARDDTPVHSVLHEAGHIICMPAARRDGLIRDAGGDALEEAAVCYLQLLLSDDIAGFGRDRAMRDMDEWGYSFRLGNTRAWFEQDACDARDWLLGHALIDRRGRPSYRLRGV